MYFIEHLCTTAQKENHLDFVRMMQRDILRVVDAVAPSDGSGAANVKVVRKVLAGLQQKSILLPATVTELEECLTERDAPPRGGALSPISPNTTRGTLGEGERDKDAKGNVAPAAGTRLDKRQIEQRIEEDRERHKRLRESIWAVGEDGEGEFEQLWDEASDIGEDDFLAAEEDAEERRLAGEVE